MDLSFENQLETDLAVLAKAQQATGRAAFDDDQHCERLRTALERVLVNRDDFRTYDRLLTSICRDQIQYLDELPETLFEEIVTAGICQVDHEWLARLVLDPIWVRMLSDEISKRFPEAWWEAMHRDGARMRAEHVAQLRPSQVSNAPAQADESAGSPWETPFAVALHAGGKKAASGGAAAGQVWHRSFPITARDGHWRFGSPADVDRQTAEIDLEWSAEEGLTAVLSGFLKLGPGFVVEAIWTSIRNGERSAARDTADNVDRLLTLKHPDGRAPQPEDQLFFLHRRLPAAGSGWEFELEITLDQTCTPRIA